MYGTSEQNASQVSAGVIVEPIPDREGQLLRIALEDRLNPNGVTPEKPAYRLSASLSRSAGGIGVARDGTVSRYNLYLDSIYTLYRTSDNKPVAAGKLRRVSSFSNVTNGYFSTFVSEQDALKRGVVELAEEYRMRLASYLASPDAGKPLEKMPNLKKPGVDAPTIPDLPNISTMPGQPPTTF